MGRFFLISILAFACPRVEAAAICRSPDHAYTVQLPAGRSSASLFAHGSLIQALMCLAEGNDRLHCRPFHQSSGGFELRIEGGKAVVIIRSLDGAFPIAELPCR